MMPPPLSLYVHMPWCVRKCPYCDFNSHTLNGELPQVEYVDALLRDLDQDLPLVPTHQLHSIFFGGGTPSLFGADSIACFLDAVARRLSMPADVEVTLETNPGTVEHAPFDDYRRAGVNRISFGVQSFDDAALRRIGRIHTASEAKRAIKQAQDAGIDNLNLDLMYAMPEQTLDAALFDIDTALMLRTPHLSHYQLTLEPNTRFGTNPPPLPDEDTAWKMQQQCQARLAHAGLGQYEVSAYARDGRQCAHNLNYWRFGDYLGIGAGAHGKLTDTDSGQIRRRWKLRTPRGFLEHAGTRRGIGGDGFIDTEQLPFEFMLNALRLNAGFEVNDFAARTGLPFDAIAARIEAARRYGWLECDGTHVQTTELGQRFLNDVIASFLPDPTPSDRELLNA